jgi:Uma2 family endonuclease
MAAPSLPNALTVDEYLKSSYRPDCDFVDGQLEERNLGEYDHATIQSLLDRWLGLHELEWGVRTRVELRVQVSETRFRVPDVCVLRRVQPIEQIIRHAPLICIEILSPDDSIQSMRQRVADYHNMGVENVWLIDPASREGLICTPSAWTRPPDGKLVVPGTQITIPLGEIFAGLDEETPAH